MERENFSFESRETEILKRVPPQFHGALSLHAYQTGHAYGEEEVLSHLEELVSMLEKPINEYGLKIYNEGWVDGASPCTDEPY